MVNIETIKKEYDELLQQLSDPELISNWEKFEELSKKKSFLEKIIEKGKGIGELENQMQESKGILNSQEDPELSVMAERFNKKFP